MNSLRFVSFNCCGAGNKLPIIADLCVNADIVFLQETWLMPSDLNLLDNVSSDFYSHSISSVDPGQLLIGRPHGGVSILWRKSISYMCKVVLFDEDRLLGLEISESGNCILAINVYLPYYSEENVDEYLILVGKITAILEEYGEHGVMILGDFNACPGGRYYCEWEKVCHDYDLTFSDISALPASSVTHVNNGTLVGSWLDHCLSTQTVQSSIAEVDIDCNYFGSDHFPIAVRLNFRSLPRMSSRRLSRECIAWNFDNEEKVSEFYNRVQGKLGSQVGSLSNYCFSRYCDSADHRSDLDSSWMYITEAIRESGRSVFGLTQNAAHSIPGWNSHVRDLYDESRSAFLTWRCAGSPRDSALATSMKHKRMAFKNALKLCRANEDSMRAESLAAKLRSNRTISFWAEARKMSGGKRKLPQNIDNVSGDESIAEMWRTKYSCVLNSVDDRADKAALESALRYLDREPFELFTVEDVGGAARKLNAHKSAGADLIPGEVFIYAPRILLLVLTNFLNSAFSHLYLPLSLTDIVVRPVLKCNLKSPTDSGNYRPIAVANSASKLFEELLLLKLEMYLHTSDNQFGFKPKHSTDMCILALKDTIEYYRTLGTPVFTCFLDIKSAYDRVSHSRLFLKLIDRGVPVYVVMLLKFWYSHQRLCVEWGTATSDTFGMSNGIRQGSLISPYFFNVYVDELNSLLDESKLGCYIGGRPSNNFSYADDVAILAPTARALNGMLSICNEFAKENLLEFSPVKSVVMRILPPGYHMQRVPNIYLGSTVLASVDEFKYLGHIITADFMDDLDIERERRKLATRGNVLIRKFGKCSAEVKCYLFRTYCYQLYGCSLWSRFRLSTLNRLRVCFNNVLRKLVGLPPWCSASSMFANLNVRSFQEVRRYVAFSLLSRISVSVNTLICALRDSDAAVLSSVRKQWMKLLCPT